MLMQELFCTNLGDFVGLDFAPKIPFSLPLMLAQNDPGASCVTDQSARSATIFLKHALLINILYYVLFLEFVHKIVIKENDSQYFQSYIGKLLTLFHITKVF